MAKTTTPEMAEHIASEVTTLAHCFYIEQTSGRIIRMTDHDQNISVGGNTYFSTLGFNLSAIETTAGMNTDNASVTIGLDENVFKRADFVAGRFRDAVFGIFIVNWQAPDDGQIWLKKGFVGTATMEEEKSEVTLELLGMTAALQGRSIEQFSPTCRANLGDARCGYCNLPNKIRVNRQQLTTGNFFVNPALTNATLPNSSWESDGDVPESTSGITAWDRTPNSVWGVASDFNGLDGAYYLFSAYSTFRNEMWQDATTSELGINNSNVLSGKAAVTVSCGISTYAEDEDEIGQGALTITAFDADGIVLTNTVSKVIGKEQNLTKGTWVVVSSTMLLPIRTKTIRFGVRAYGNSKVAFDNYQLWHWTHDGQSTFNDHCVKTVRIHNNTTNINVVDNMNLQNSTFSAQGLVANGAASITSGWSSPQTSFWRTDTAYGALEPLFGQYMLIGGDDGSNVQKIYSIEQSREVAPFNPQQSDIANNWWYVETVLRFANIENNQSDFRITIYQKDASDVVVATQQSAWLKSLLVNQWDAKPQRLGAKLVADASKITLVLEVRSAIGSSAANIAIDSAELYLYPVAYEGDNDPPWGNLAPYDVTSSGTIGDFTTDGDLLLQSQVLNFDYGTVSAPLDEMSFMTTSISFTPKEMFGGAIYWLTGENSGLTTYCRIFDSTSGIVYLYENLYGPPEIGDKFIYSKGCDKTIDTCADRFNNAINFRGEPYLPGTENIVTFLNQT